MCVSDALRGFLCEKGDSFHVVIRFSFLHEGETVARSRWMKSFPAIFMTSSCANSCTIYATI